jgi:ABC-2 type transport system permease protein
MESARLMLMYLKFYNRAKMANKKGFVIEFCMSFVDIGVNFFLFRVILGKIGIIDGWAPDEASFYYAVSLFMFSITSAVFGLALYFIDNAINSGSLDMYITKPNGVLIHLFSRNIHFFLFTSAVSALGLTIFLSVRVLKSLDVWRIVYFVFSLLCGALLYGAIYIFFMSLSFKFKKTGELRNMMFAAKNLTQFPLSMFPAAFKYALTFVLPLAFVTYYPCLMLFGKEGGLFDMTFAATSPFLCLIIFFSAKRFFYKSMNKYYTSSGN